MSDSTKTGKFSKVGGLADSDKVEKMEKIELPRNPNVIADSDLSNTIKFFETFINVGTIKNIG